MTVSEQTTPNKSVQKKENTQSKTPNSQAIPIEKGPSKLGKITIENQINDSSVSQVPVKKPEIKAAPPWGCLKNSKTPTYREYFKKNKPTFTSKPADSHLPPLLKKEKKTIKYKLGKSKRKINVLIKNQQTRRRIRDFKSGLNQQGVAEVKKYLRSKNMLKAGSDAPVDLLKTTYKALVLAGNISNESDDVAVHNYTAGT